MSNICVFGDSFAGFDIRPELAHTHWIGKLKEHFSGYNNPDQLVMTALGGSGPMDHIHQFYKHLPQVNNSDILIFVWSQSSRLFHSNPETRDINVGSCLHKDHRQFPLTSEQDKLYELALRYYEEFYYEKNEEIKMVGMLQWFDRILLENYSNKKIFHFQSFSTCRENGQKNLQDQVLYHKFNSGINVGPPLMYLSENEPDFSSLGMKDKRPGHLNQDNHNLVFQKLVQEWDKNKGDTILLDDNYKPTYTLDYYSKFWKDLWKY